MKNKSKTPTKIPAHTSMWADKYFHQSAFDMPIAYPSQKVISFLSQFKTNQPLRLFRGLNRYNESKSVITSWTYDKKIAERYIKEVGGKILTKTFSPSNILLDTTVLTYDQKRELGYDYTLDDKEVLVYE